MYSTRLEVEGLRRRNVPGRLWLFELARCAWAVTGIGVNSTDHFAFTPWAVEVKVLILVISSCPAVAEHFPNQSRQRGYALRIPGMAAPSARSLPPTLRILQIKVNRGTR
jgi:hypothetical protein